jgi:hypothetical protein
MGQFTGTTFGIGTPAMYQPIPGAGSFSPYAGQAFGISAFPQQPYISTVSNPFTGPGLGTYGAGGASSFPLQQIAQLLQIVPQQLQHVQLLQQQQLQQLQQLLQWVPAQLQQLQQLIQVLPHQVQQLQHQGPPGFGLVPQAFSGQGAGYVM